jgi:hypothetical protein
MASQIEIPSLTDMMIRIERWMQAEVINAPSDRLHAEVNRVLDCESVGPDHLFDLIAWGMGCHTVAEELRRRDHGDALVFHFFGQTMLGKAGEVMANMAVAEMRRIGEKRH